MNTERMSAFSDGVIAIIITNMVLDLKGGWAKTTLRHCQPRSTAWC